jgi:hypothetical protein
VAGVSASSGCAAVARRVLSLAPAAVAGAAVVAAWVAACETRSVFLVPKGAATATQGTLPHDAGRPPPASHPVEAGHHPIPMDNDAGAPHRDAGMKRVDGGHLACETQRYQQVPQPLGIYVLVDQSNAMLQQWDAVSTALSAFFRESDELGAVSIGIQYYALSPQLFPAEPYLSTVCNWTSYEGPDVPIAALPMNRDPLLLSLTSHGPLSLSQLFSKLSLALTLVDESPIDSALHGAIEGARDWVNGNATVHPAAAVLLVTTSIATPMMSPNCMPTREKAMAAASAGLTGFPSVRTYVLGVGGPNSDLNDVAFAGGTQTAYAVTNGVGVLDALSHFRETVLPCDVSVSVNEPELIAGKLNVELSVIGKTPERYGRVKSSGDCSAAPTRGEWFVEGSGGSATVKLCPSTCEAARNEPDAKLDVVLGCQTTFVQ